MNRYITLINILLLTFGAFCGVKAFYRILTEQLDYDPRYRAVSRRPAPSREDRASKPSSYYDTIVERDLFNTAKGDVEEEEQIDVEALKQTELKLKLLGTVTGEGRDAYAVIKEQTERQENLYRTGDTIQRAILKMILRRKVILSVDGRDEVLEIEEATSSAGPRERPRAPTRSSSRTSARSENRTLRRSQIEAAVEDVSGLMQSVNIRPNIEDGEPNGLLLTKVVRNSIFSKMGLRRGDVIMGVDGEEIASVDDALGLYNKLRNATSVELEIKRRGVPKKIDYRIR